MVDCLLVWCWFGWWCSTATSYSSSDKADLHALTHTQKHQCCPLDVDSSVLRLVSTVRRATSSCMCHHDRHITRVLFHCEHSASPSQVTTNSTTISTTVHCFGWCVSSRTRHNTQHAQLVPLPSPPVRQSMLAFQVQHETLPVHCVQRPSSLCDCGS